jgi:hypothetical protein
MGTIIMFYETLKFGLMQNRKAQQKKTWKKQQKSNWNSSEWDKTTTEELQCNAAVGFVSEAANQRHSCKWKKSEQISARVGSE